MHLRTLRIQRGWTQAELARQAKVAQNTISKLETAFTRQPDFNTVMAVTRALGCDPRRVRFGPPSAAERRLRVRRKRRPVAA